MQPSPRRTAPVDVPIRSTARSPRAFARLALVATLLSFAVACSDGGGTENGGVDIFMSPFVDTGQTTSGTPFAPGSGSTTSGAPPPSSDPAPPPSQTASGGATNGPLTGRLITTGDVPHRNALLSLDLQSGVYSYLDGADSPETIDAVNRENTSRRFTPDPSAPGRFVETQYQCFGNVRIKCVSLRDAGAVEGQGFFYDDPDVDLPGTGMAKRSRDGRLIAFTDYRADTLEIRDLDGEVVSTDTYTTFLGSPYDWLPDGRLLIAYDDSGFGVADSVNFYRTEPGSAKRDSRVDMPARYSGSVRNLVIDPSGTRAAMTLRLSPSDGNQRRPVVLDLDTLAIYEPVAPDDRTGTLDADFLHWSPDGQWLIFQNPQYRPLLTTVPIAPQSGQGLPRSVTYAVRADGGSYPLPLTVEESNENARIVVARPKDLTDGPLAPGNAEPGYVWTD